jgi:uncharacterized membrane protein
VFGFLKRKRRFFSEEEKLLVSNAIRQAEQCTSGEIRVYIESKCSFMDAIDRAKELFTSMGMENTAQRNGVLVYIAIDDHQLAVYGDAGIHEKVGTIFWNKLVSDMIRDFNKENYAEGIAHCIQQIGTALGSCFPYDRATDKNELSDDITFGA